MRPLPRALACTAAALAAGGLVPEEHQAAVLRGVAAGRRIEDILAELGVRPGMLYNGRRLNPDFEAALLAASRAAPAHTQDARAQYPPDRHRDGTPRCAVEGRCPRRVTEGRTIRQAAVVAGCSVSTYRLRRDDREWARCWWLRRVLRGRGRERAPSECWDRCPARSHSSAPSARSESTSPTSSAPFKLLGR